MKFLAAAILLAVPVLAHAQDKPPQMLTVEQVIKISNGLSQLDCYQPMDGGMQQGCKKQYDIALAVRLVVARNIDKGSAVFQSYQKARNARIRALQNDKGDLIGEAKSRFEIEDREALEASSGVVMDHLKQADVLKESTPMPATTLSLILPILD